ncbi:hypothetical protein TraAM80_07269 [Trypanosoma rangeli]|uniref:Uncharacterized protein n=1 Tax=Trypanosoma rangeli TaxID=5698 RepID=A0A3R7LPR6_TRYRA|nr:uncharacterized protein TraAM80_07269 [Trypanosoma rangeli]RNF01026.1 hypothetical protein TraAM80_07269 [Trypanosoma rangeli]|eukprot:RNF01026.1 hypothetical protein TraAM80_07269 [Trypanosoma rangeli]
MYAAHHRVAPLRRGDVTAGRRCAPTPCDSFVPTPMGTREDPHTQRNTQVRCGAVSCHAVAPAGVYSPPAPLQQSRLAAPPTSDPLRSSQMSMHAASTPTTSTMPLTQVQLGDASSLQATLSQASRHHKETASALLSLAQCMQQQEKHLASNSHSLSHLAALVDSQHAQVTALHSLTTEVRTMVAAIRDAAAVLQKTQSVKEPPTPRRNSVRNQPRIRQLAPTAAPSTRFGLVLGADSPFMTPCARGEEEEEQGMFEKGGAAHVCHSHRSQFMLQATEGCAAASEFIEDDIFSM